MSFRPHQGLSNFLSDKTYAYEDINIVSVPIRGYLISYRLKMEFPITATKFPSPSGVI